MNITHIVLFKFKPTTSEEQIQACFTKLAELTDALPIIRSFRWGKYDSQEGLHQDFTHSFMMTFDNAADRDLYLFHPEHLKIAQFIQQHIEFPSGVIAFDSTFAN
ncbi:MAG: Dabb family protein [Gammaproteobacteria bacterium]